MSTTTETTNNNKTLNNNTNTDQFRNNDMNAVSLLKFRRSNSVHDLGPFEFDRTKTTLFEVKDRVRASLLSEKRREEEKEKEQTTTTTTTTTTATVLKTEDVKIIYMGKVLEGCDSNTLQELGFPGAGALTICHAHVLQKKGKASIGKLAGMSFKSNNNSINQSAAQAAVASPSQQQQQQQQQQPGCCIIS